MGDRSEDGMSRRDLLRLLGKVALTAGAASAVASVLPGCDGGSNEGTLPEGCELYDERISDYDHYTYMYCDHEPPGMYCSLYAYGYAYGPQGYHYTGQDSYFCIRYERAE
ncbi:MAG: hypothetical protein JXR96_03265 [Deltaproteobacteria bacterium]|nr:hypothetical protein [Deltaproteobacteria bacterium]